MTIKTKKNTNQIQLQAQPKRNPWTNLVDFLRRVNAARRVELLSYNKRLSLLSHLAKTINSSIEINKILRLILKGAVNLTHSNTGVIFFRGRKKLRAIESYGIKVAPVDLIIRPWRGIVGQVLSSESLYLCNNTDKDKYFVPWASGKRSHSELAVPIIIDQKVKGVLIVSSRDYGKYAKVDELLLKDLSENASIAIKNAEQNIILEQEVRERTKKLSRLNFRLRESLASKMQFVADVSHELRTPLTVIRGNIELLKRSQHKIPASDQEAMQDVIEETKNISDKLENLINLIHQDARADEIQIKQFDFSKMINEVIEITKKLAREKNIKVIIKNNLKILFVGDREKVKEMMINLCANAVKYNHSRGKIWLGVKVKDQNIKLEISDTGIGIAKTDLPFIFDRFYRAKDIEHYKKKGGSGIGLAVSRWIAKAHGGDIRVQSKVGIGTKFTIILPFSHS
jgi:signal transduction histidine kinase